MVDLFVQFAIISIREGEKMRKEQIKTALKKSGFTAQKIAAALNTSPQNFSKKLNRETLTDQELSLIAATIGAEYKSVFVFPDGKEI